MQQRRDPWVDVQTGLVPVPRAHLALSGSPVLKTAVVSPNQDTQEAVRSLLTGLVFAAIAGYHGFKRNDSAFWGLAWAAGGFVCPSVTLAFAVNQGYGKKDS